MKRILIGAVLIVAIAIAIFILAGRGVFTTSPSVIVPPLTATAEPTTTVDVTIVPSPQTILNEGTSVDGVSHFVEQYPKIDGQQGYAAIPKEVKADAPPAIVIYYHGSGQTITTNFANDVMKNMRTYGDFFAKNNMIFLASNQHGDNQGNKIAVEDSRALIAWTRKRYLTSSKVYVLGFSMGGKPAMRHVILYPKDVSKIALLAPAQQVETYSSSQIKEFKKVLLKVWHGTADVNVPYWVTEELQTYFKKYGAPLEVVTLKGKTHWDVDTEYRDDILKWYLQPSEK